MKKKTTTFSAFFGTHFFFLSFIIKKGQDFNNFCINFNAILSTKTSSKSSIASYCAYFAFYHTNINHQKNKIFHIEYFLKKNTNRKVFAFYRSNIILSLVKNEGDTQIFF